MTQAASPSLFTRTIKVCGKYPLEVISPVSEEQLTEHSFYRHFPKFGERNARCFEHLIEGLPEGMSVVEHFGGIGMTGVIVENALKPREHKIFDVDDYCVRQLKHTFGEKAQYGDAKEVMGTVPADLITLDFPAFNAFREPLWPLDRVFAVKPKYITLADIARQRIGLHRELYSRLFERPVHTNEDYIEAISNRWYKKYGWAVRKCASHIHSVMLLTEGAPTPIDYWKL